MSEERRIATKVPVTITRVAPTPRKDSIDIPDTCPTDAITKKDLWASIIWIIQDVICLSNS